MIDPEKYGKAELPKDAATALAWAKQREDWASIARYEDRHGSAKEFELTALLLRHYAAEAAST